MIGDPNPKLNFAGMNFNVVKTHVPITKKVQNRFPKTRKKRIIKKWRQRDCNFKTVDAIVLMPRDGLLLANPHIRGLIGVP